MIRYFYTDPLAAAWMHKHFGMNFCVPWAGTYIRRNCKITICRGTTGMAGSEAQNDFVKIVFSGQECISKTDYSEWESIRGGIGEGPEPYYILTETLDGWIANHVPEKLYIHPDSLYLLDEKKGDLCFTTNDQSRPKIITRSSISFMWPEKETI